MPIPVPILTGILGIFDKLLKNADPESRAKAWSLHITKLTKAALNLAEVYFDQSREALNFIKFQLVELKGKSSNVEKEVEVIITSLEKHQNILNRLEKKFQKYD